MELIVQLKAAWTLDYVILLSEQTSGILDHLALKKKSDDIGNEF